MFALLATWCIILLLLVANQPASQRSFLLGTTFCAFVLLVSARAQLQQYTSYCLGVAFLLSFVFYFVDFEGLWEFAIFIS